MLQFLQANRIETPEDEWEFPIPQGDFIVSPVDSIAEAIRAATSNAMELTILHWDIAQEQAETLARLTVESFKAFPQLSANSNQQQILRIEPDELDLRGGFAPSQSLVEYWVRGVRAAAERAGYSPEQLVATPTDLKQEFAKNLTSVLGMVAQQLRYEREPDNKITQHRRFVLRLQIELCDRFLVIPDEAGEFLSLLRVELINAIRSGARISGEWGAILYVNEDELKYELRAPVRAIDPAFVRSEPVE